MPGRTLINRFISGGYDIPWNTLLVHEDEKIPEAWELRIQYNELAQKQLSAMEAYLKESILKWADYPMTQQECTLWIESLKSRMPQPETEGIYPLIRYLQDLMGNEMLETMQMLEVLYPGAGKPTLGTDASLTKGKNKLLSGVENLMANRLDKARENFESILFINPSDTHALTWMAFTFLHLNRPTNAENYFKLMFDSLPHKDINDRTRAYEVWARSYYANQNYIRAMEIQKKAVEVSTPEMRPRALYRLATYLFLGGFEVEYKKRLDELGKVQPGWYIRAILDPDWKLIQERLVSDYEELVTTTIYQARQQLKQAEEELEKFLDLPGNSSPSNAGFSTFLHQQVEQARHLLGINSCEHAIQSAALSGLLLKKLRLVDKLTVKCQQVENQLESLQEKEKHKGHELESLTFEEHHHQEKARNIEYNLRGIFYGLTGAMLVLYLVFLPSGNIKSFLDHYQMIADGKNVSHHLMLALIHLVTLVGALMVSIGVLYGIRRYSKTLHQRRLYSWQVMVYEPVRREYENIKAELQRAEKQYQQLRERLSEVLMAEKNLPKLDS